MKEKSHYPRDQYAAFERALKKSQQANYLLRLYVSGATPKSLRAIENIKRICEEHLKGRYRLEVVDVYQRPVLAKGEQILAAPTLIKYLPAPLRRFIGDMANAERILLGLDLKPATRDTETQGRTARNGAMETGEEGRKPEGRRTRGRGDTED